MVSAPRTADSGAESRGAEGVAAKIEWIDLRACICRMDRSEVGGELEERAAEALLPPSTMGRGEGVRENRLGSVGEAERWQVELLDCPDSDSTTLTGGMRVRLRLRVDVS